MSSHTADLAYADTQEDIARRVARYAQWQAHSRRIHQYRLGLPAAIGLIVLILLGFVVYRAVADHFVANDDQKVSIRMINPKFHGRNKDGLPYVVSATSAARDDRNFQRVILENPVFTQNANTPTQSEVRAVSGVYMEDTRVLSLETDVILTDERGYKFKTHHSVVDTRDAVIKGQSAVEGLGPLGQIAASSYAVEDGGARVIFRGKVRARIETNR